MRIVIVSTGLQVRITFSSRRGRIREAVSTGEDPAGAASASSRRQRAESDLSLRESIEGEDDLSVEHPQRARERRSGLIMVSELSQIFYPGVF